MRLSVWSMSVAVIDVVFRGGLTYPPRIVHFEAWWCVHNIRLPAQVPCQSPVSIHHCRYLASQLKAVPHGAQGIIA